MQSVQGLEVRRGKICKTAVYGVVEGRKGAKKNFNEFDPRQVGSAILTRFRHVKEVKGTIEWK